MNEDTKNQSAKSGSQVVNEDKSKAELERSENMLSTFGSGVEEAIDKENREEEEKEAGATGDKIKDGDHPDGSRTKVGSDEKTTGKTDMKGDKFKQSSPRKPDSEKKNESDKGQSCCS